MQVTSDTSWQSWKNLNSADHYYAAQNFNREIACLYHANLYSSKNNDELLVPNFPHDNLCEICEHPFTDALKTLGKMVFQP